MTKEDIILELIAQIKTERLAPGTWLVERDLSEIYGISRTPVREILREVAATGLVEFQPSKGYRVKEFGFDEILHIFNAREAVEGLATRLACQMGDAAFFEKMREMEEALGAFEAGNDTSRGIELGRSLHDLLVETAGNPILIEFYNKLKNYTDLTRNITSKFTSIEANSQNAHLKILSALRQRDPDQSEFAMREHLRETYRGLVEGYISAHAGFAGKGVSLAPKTAQ